MSELFRTEMTVDEVLIYIDQHSDQRFDFTDGELVEVSPKPIHGYIQSQLTALLVNWSKQNKVGYVHTEVLHVLDGNKFIPDISVNAQTAHNQSHFDTPPLVAVEIRSDTQSRASQQRKAQEYIRRNTPTVMLIFPNEGIELYTKEEIRSYKLGQTVRDILGLDGLLIDVDDVLVS